MPCVVLVRSQMGENIGAAARAMMNFGLKELRLVAPRDGWPNAKALEMSAHATHIIEQATVFDSLAEAVADCTLVIAASARRRDLAMRYLEPVAAAQEMVAQSHRAAWVFGPENNGLSNEDVAHCNAVVTIPTHPDNSSLNIAQSVGILAYETFKASGAHAREPENAEAPASHDSVQKLIAVLDEALDARGFYKTAELKPKMQQTIRAMLGRMVMSQQEVQVLWGMMMTLLKREV